MQSNTPQFLNSSTTASGILDRPIKSGDDSDSVARACADCSVARRVSDEALQSFCVDEAGLLRFAPAHEHSWRKPS